jgi:hypothetical protein
MSIIYARSLLNPRRFVFKAQIQNHMGKYLNHNSDYLNISINSDETLSIEDPLSAERLTFDGYDRNDPRIKWMAANYMRNQKFHIHETFLNNLPHSLYNVSYGTYLSVGSDKEGDMLNRSLMIGEKECFRITFLE